ncbi:UNVERIFIED_CONTAM: hypothetical protein Sradi_3970300 [Sesamum radiatum]|uniref:Uncharacterized protein n=1 Tax=Sesamum radiatum TaxID=300843 RepID=A0AAW2PGD0_SESRA
MEDPYTGIESNGEREVVAPGTQARLDLILDEPILTRDEDTGKGKELVLYNSSDVLVLDDDTAKCSTKGPKERSPPMVPL